MINMLDPRKVGVASGRRAKLPTHIALQLVLAPIAVVEWRIGENVIGLNAGVEILVEGIGPFAAKVRFDAANSKVHLGQPPCRGIGLLPVNGNVVAPALVRFDKMFGLHEHAA